MIDFGVFYGNPGWYETLRTDCSVDGRVKLANDVTYKRYVLCRWGLPEGERLT